MNSFRKWLYKPKKTDKSLLAQFYFADEELNTVASELDSFDSRKDPERCQALVAQLRACQDKVLTIIQRMMAEAIPYARSSRDFRVKFPDDVVQENLAGQLWFGAECLAAGSSIMNRELESASMRPLARALTKNLDSLRHMLRDQCLINVNEYTERIREALTIFDKLFAEFELSYVSAMVPVKSVKEYETIQEITVLFSETAIRAKTRGYVTTDMIDEYDPALMFTIPRLAIVYGLLIFADGPLNPDSQSLNMSDMFRPFQTLLYKIRELLFTLSDGELLTLERALCSQEEPAFLSSTSPLTSTTTTTSGCVSMSTIAVQTDSPIVKRRGRSRGSDAVSCSSADRLDNNGSDDISLTPEQQRRVGRGRCLEQIVCQSGRISETPPSDAAFCEFEDAAAGQVTQFDSSSRQSKNLNKSDSNDSGLHSDVVSTCDSHFTVSPSDSSQLISQSGYGSPLQSPVVDEVIELCMGQSGAESLIADNQCRSRFVEHLHSEEVKHGEEENGLNSDDQEKTLVSREDVYEDCSDDRISGEDDSFYTPSSDLSPLHQPHCSDDARQASHHREFSVVEAVAHDSDLGDNTHEDMDDNKENIEDPAPEGLAQVDISLENTCGHVYNVLQKVQEAIVSHHGSTQSVDDDICDNTSDVNNSSLTDSTLTDITPDTDIVTQTSSDDTLLPFSAPVDSTDSTMTTACPPDCDTTNSRHLSQASCDNESQNQKLISESKLPSQPAGTNAGIVSVVEVNHLSTGTAVTEVEANVSHKQCDRCTQTPHSSINNDQSSKIYHHHHHHHSRQHSNTQAVGSSSAAVSTQNTPRSSAQKRRNSFTNDDEMRSMSETAHQASTSVRQLSESVKNIVEKSLRSARKRGHSAKTGKASRRTRKQRPPGHSEAETEARMRRYEDNWSNCSSNSENDRTGRKRKEEVAVKALAETSSGSSCCEESSSTSDCESDEESCGSSETSSYNSESHDDEEIALAVQAAELANRNQARARFRSSSDMIHRLFVCVSGVADQLQTNFAGDLRNILRVVFNLNCSEPVVMEDEKTFRRHRRRGARFFHQQFGGDASQNRVLRDPPAWIPDDQSTMCMSCKTLFTFVRRRHHCRNCGKIFCGRCSSNAVSLPHFGHSKPVRVCNHCFVFQVNPFAMQAQI